MKKILFIIAAALLSSFAASAQVMNLDAYPLSYTDNEPAEGIEVGMKYKEIKKIYDYNMYQETLYDRYNPTLSGIASFFVPGLGQIVSGETGRGFAWWGGSLACAFTYGIGYMVQVSAAISGSSTTENIGTVISAAGALALLTVDICAIVDAVRVAKVKNMYEQDLRKMHSINLALRPSVNQIQTANGTQTTAGLTFAMTF